MANSKRKKTAGKKTQSESKFISVRTLMGKQFGRWYVINIAPNNAKGNPQWLCRCTKCGLEKVVAESTLIKGRPIACNCSIVEAEDDDIPFETASPLKSETKTESDKPVKAVKTAPTVVRAVRVKSSKPKALKTASKAKKPIVKAVKDNRFKLFAIWQNIARKCSPADPTGKYYSKGITLDKGWRVFTHFAKWAESLGYDGSQKIARKSDLKGFNPKNCYLEK